MLSRPSKTVHKSRSLKKPVLALSRRAVRVTATVVLAVKDLSAKALRMFTDKEPNEDKFADRPMVTKGLTLKKLLSKTKQQQLELSMAVVVKNVRRLYHKKSLNRILVCETYSKKTGKNATGYDKYVTFIEALHTKNSDKFSETFVKVGCTCPFFTFFCEVALSKFGAATILFSNGELPVVKNPKLTPILCKHLVKLCYRIQEKKL